MRKLAINIRSLHSQNIRGFSRYLMNILKGLALNHEGIELVLVSDIAVDKKHLEGLDLNYTLIENRRLPSLLWLHFVLPFILLFQKVDIYFSVHNQGVSWLRSLGVKRGKDVVSIHDMIAFSDVLESPNSLAKKLFLFNWNLNRKSDVLLTVSEYSKGEILKHFPQKEIQVLYNSVESLFYISKPRENYLFYIGGFEKRKNIEVLMKGYEKYYRNSQEKKSLKLAGKISSADKDRFLSFIQEGNVEFLGYVPDEELPALYASSFCCLTPSLEEGFGLQIAEAYASETPVISSDRTSLPEIAADGALFFDPSSFDELAKKIIELEEDNALYLSLQQKAKERSQDFSIQDLSLKYLNFFRSLND